MDGKPANNKSPPGAVVKKENEEEIKEFAETAMNELLGWYGYERLELRRWAASRARDASSPEQNSDQKNKDECTWCNKSITSESGALQHAGATFCSELCFSQSRRANFKRAKTCDWCRHVRHTVAYVDFQDGATQLQFCSDKCLNQYKMHIFCRETQAHLDLNPHLVNASSSSNLITPELWLKNCKSRSTSPTSDRSASPSLENLPNKPEKTDAPKCQNRKSPLPLITIAPASKLMKQKRSEESTIIQKSPDAKKDLRSIKMNLRKRRTSKCSATVTSQTVRQRTATPKAQDLRMCSPSEGSSPASTITNAMHSPPQPINSHSIQPPPPFHNSMFGMPPPVFMENQHDFRHPNMFPPRLGYMPRPGIPVHHERPRLPPPINFPPQLGQVPPVTVMVPYPVVLPVPIPIPVPIPLTAFLQAHCANKIKTEPRNEETEGPLDFTMNSEKRKNEEPADVAEPNHEEIVDSATNTPTMDINGRVDDDDEKLNNEPNEPGNPEQTLPKFKITRIGNKMAKIVSKTREPSESTRPLRKRRRLVEVSTDEEPLIPKTRKIVEV